MSSMITFLKKPADKSELMAALEYFNPSKLNIFILIN